MVKAELPNQAEGVGALLALVEMGGNGSALLELTSFCQKFYVSREV